MVFYMVNRTHLLKLFHENAKSDLKNLEPMIRYPISIKTVKYSRLDQTTQIKILFLNSSL